MQDWSAREAKIREALESKVKEHARVAIYYRKQHENKFEELREVHIRAFKKAREHSLEVEKHSIMIMKQRAQIDVLIDTVKKLEKNVTMLQAQKAPFKKNE